MSHSISYLQDDASLFYHKKVRRAAINYSAILGLLYVCFDFFVYFTGDWMAEYYLTASVVTVCVIMLFFNHTGKERLAQFTFFSTLPFLFGAISATFGFDRYNSDVLYLILICVGLVCYKQFKPRAIIIGWSFLCYTFAAIYLYHYGSKIQINSTLLDKYVLGITGISIAVIIIFFLIRADFSFARKLAYLSKEVKSKHTILEGNSEELHNTNTDLQNFISIASRDLKSPIQSIIDAQQKAIEKIQSSQNHELLDFLNTANSSAIQMREVLDDLVRFTDLSNEDAVAYFEKVDLKTLITQIQTELKKTIPHGNVIIEEELGYIKSIKSQLKLVLQNLILNGLKYNEAKTPTVRIKKGKEDHLSIDIIDNGIGISEENIEIIFEPFKRLRSDKYEGSGFGLSITKRILKRLGGNIEVISAINKGSTFRLVFSDQSQISNLT